MKWCAYNAFGGAAWLGGILLAKAATATATNGSPWIYEPHILAGLSVGTIGLVVLLWTNFRTSS